MLAKLRTSCLSAKDADALLLKPFEEGHGLPISPKWSGFKIPYFTLDGKPDDFFRFRFVQDQPSTGWGSVTEAPPKPRRYAQPAGTGCGVYMPPLLDQSWAKIAKNADTPLVITEGELKSACACKLGVPTLGLGGVWSWKSAKSKISFLPVLESFKWSGRGVNLCFDSDVATNTMVRGAASALARELAVRGALVGWTQLTPGADGAKRGLDDLAFQDGSDALMEAFNKMEILGPGVALHELSCDVALLRSTGEVVEMSTGNVWSASMFTDVTYRNKTYIDWDTESGKPKTKHAAKEWIAWPLRNELARSVYEPAIDSLVTENGEYNSWKVRGWGCEPSKKGDVAPWEYLLTSLFAGVEPSTIQWVRQWFAWPIAHPGAKMASALLIWGRQQGTGKTLLGETMSRIYGQNYGTVTNTELGGQFNEWIQDKQFIVGDELSLGDKRHIANAIKDMVTRSRLRINSKNRKTYEVRDCVNFYFTSNYEDAMYVDSHDRRLLVHHVDKEPLRQSEYESYIKWLDSGGAARLFYYFLHEVSFTNFDPHARPPMTAAKMDLAAATRGDLEDWCVQLKTDPDSVLASRYPWDLFRTQDLLDAYDPEKRGRAKVGGMSRALGAAGIMRVARGVNTAKIDGVRSRLWAVRNTELYKRMGPADAARTYAVERDAKKIRNFEKKEMRQ